MRSTHSRARRCRTARRAVAALLGILATAQVAIAQDPAYIDSPAGRESDPARADGGSIPPADPRMPRARAGGGAEQAALLQMQIQLAQQAMANAREQEASNAALQAGVAATGQPGLPATPMQQVGSGLLQDAGGLIDAGIQRQIEGSNGTVIVAPPYSQSGLPEPGQFDPLAPPATDTW